MKEWVDVCERLPGFGEMVFLSESIAPNEHAYLLIGFRRGLEGPGLENHPWAWFMWNPTKREEERLLGITAWRTIN